MFLTRDREGSDPKAALNCPIFVSFRLRRVGVTRAVADYTNASNKKMEGGIELAGCYEEEKFFNLGKISTNQNKAEMSRSCNLLKLHGILVAGAGLEPATLGL